MKLDYGLGTIALLVAVAAFVVIVAAYVLPLLTSVGQRIESVAP